MKTQDFEVAPVVWTVSAYDRRSRSWGDGDDLFEYI
jgi:hypothetical protein